MGNKFSINLPAASSLIDDMSSMGTTMSGYKGNVEGVRNSLWGNLAAFREPLNSIIEEMEKEKGYFNRLSLVLYAGNNTYRSTETRVAGNISSNSGGEGEDGSGNPIIDWFFTDAIIENNDLKFLSSLFHFVSGSTILDLFGFEFSDDVGAIFGTTALSTFVAKLITENSEQYLGKTTHSIEDTLKGGFDNKDDAEDWLEKKGVREDLVDETHYYDSEGNEITNDGSTFYKKDVTIAEWKEEEKVSVSIYDGTFTNDLAGGGKVNVTVGEAEAHAGISAGFYVLDGDGNKKFSPGINAEIGTSATILETEWNQQWLGDEMLGLNTDVTATVGKAEAKADLGAQIFGDDGKLDVQLGASASAELIGGELKGSVGANVLGGEVGVSASVNYGIGAHADVGYRDGVLKLDLGVSVGVGASVGIELDVGGMVDTVVDGAEAAWDAVTDWGSDAIDAVGDWVDDIWPW